ncbi:MAG: biotin/lipoyl-containing protein [Anaerolineae bacterium]
MKREFLLTLDGIDYKIAADGNTIVVNGQPFTVGFQGEAVLVNEVPYEIKLEGDKVMVAGITYKLKVEGLEEEKAPSKAIRDMTPGEGVVTAIMPGKIIRVLVSEGDRVAEGDVICILEAMKMENELKTPKAGTLKALYVRPGQDVERGAILAEIQ